MGFTGRAALLAALGSVPVGIWDAGWTGLLPALGFVLTIGRWQIPAEEAALERTFGAEYDAYRRAVPRWVLR